MNYIRHVSKRVTPQSAAIAGSAQVPNSAGGYAFAIDDWARLDRFLVLGSESGSYYASERALTVESAAAVQRCLAADGPRTVARIVEVSQAGRAPKNDPAIFALALACATETPATRAVAIDAIPAVCRTGTHLFQFAAAIDELRGWGPALRRGLARGWYLLPNVERVALQAVKYKQRGGWSHRDLLRLTHARPAADDTARRALFAWIVNPDAMAADGTIDITPRTAGRKAATGGIVPPAAAGDSVVAALPSIVIAAEELARTRDAATAARLIREFDLPRESAPTELLDNVEVWDALLEHMPFTAMIRNLAKMTTIGLLAPGSPQSALVIERLADGAALRRARVHPLQILVAQATYLRGRGLRGKLTWTPVAAIADALDDAFYRAFDAVEPTGKRRLLALDVSGSMSWGSVAGSPLTPRDASAALALVAARTEQAYSVVGFTSSGRGSWTPDDGSSAVTPLPISARMRLTDAVSVVSGLPFGGTDCALPLLYARKKKLKFDSFEVYTDSETWAGSIHPIQALAQYRDWSGIDAKLTVVGMVATEFSIADPNDPGMLDVVGFDTAAPAVIADFIRA